MIKRLGWKFVKSNKLFLSCEYKIEQKRWKLSKFPYIYILNDLFIEKKYVIPSHAKYFLWIFI